MFWLGIIVLLLPIGGDTQFKTSDAIEVARSAVVDLSSFCERNPAACDAGANAVGAFGHKMTESARWAYALARDEEYVATVPPAGTRTVRTIPFDGQGFAAAPREAAGASSNAPRSVTRVIPTNEPNTTILERGTLTSDDYAPNWQGGQPI